MDRSKQPVQVSSQISKLRKVVEQLRKEANIDRAKVSESGWFLVDYCDMCYHKDPLLPGVMTYNPYKEKRSCEIV
uniref:Guanine nucleotide-binding protein subunit gamma n=1 Tax=Patiria pectinifera TaxID=7594 RepID=A0A0C6DRP2_PATPE|nr:guanine nucleotide-binding protein, gamma A [Patiria pectinifera]